MFTLEGKKILYHGELYSETGSLWMARYALKVAQELQGREPLTHTNKGRWNDWFRRRLRRAARRAPCQTCRAGVGSPCVKPSGHPVWEDNCHPSRARAFDEWILKQPTNQPTNHER